MLISIHAKGESLSDSLRTWIEDRLETAIERVAGHCQQIQVFLTDENGPMKSGLDKACRVVVQIDHQPSLVVTDRDSNVAKVIDRIADRLAIAASRRSERRREHRHG